MRASHTCHWDGCGTEIPPSMWGCAFHWKALPKVLQDAVWRHYVPGQEVKKNPSKKYIAVVQLINIYVKHFGRYRLDLSQRHSLDVLMADALEKAGL